jgi:hypothetical protein
MDNKKIMNIVETHMLKQMKRSVSSDGSCAYRGENGLKCAVGALINDEHYDKSFDTNSVPVWDASILNAIEASLDEKLNESNVDLLNELQSIHDTCEPHEWVTELDAAKEEFGIE